MSVERHATNGHRAIDKQGLPPFSARNTPPEDEDTIAAARVRAMLAAYAAKTTFSFLIAVIELLVIVWIFYRHGTGASGVYFTRSDAILAAVFVSFGAVTVAGAAVLNLAPTLRWLTSGRPPSARQRRAAMRTVNRQSGILAAAWVAVGAAFMGCHLDGGIGLVVPVAMAVLFAATAAAGTGVLVTQRAHRQIFAAAVEHRTSRATAPSVSIRLVVMWLLCSAVPITFVAVLTFVQRPTETQGTTTYIELPLLVSLTTLSLGVRAMLLVARSISDPVRDVVAAMADIRMGRMNTRVAVYEQSEIGLLQEGFNDMVGGLVERDRARDLFGRHVGSDVARQALEHDAGLSGEVRYAAVLFVDLTGSTRLAATRPPEEVAAMLNAFFAIVVASVDENGGLINKFQGDAALAIFGAPIQIGDESSAALDAARTLSARVRRLAAVDFGIGVSAGDVFAGNIGADNRYEYTVIGDSVNEAARLADLAKTYDERVLCSRTAIASASKSELARWKPCGSTTLRGRGEVTDLFAPVARTVFAQ